MKISELNVANSIRNLYNQTSQRFLRIGQMITQIWDRIRGNKQPKETFISYLKNHHFTLVTLSPEGTATFNWDINNKEFASSLLKNSIEKIESVFKKNNESLYSYIKPIIDRSNIREDLISFQENCFNEELKKVQKELNDADTKANEDFTQERETYQTDFNNLKEEKEQELHNREQKFKQEFGILQQQITDFPTLMKTVLIDPFNSRIAENTGNPHIQQSKQLSSITENLIEKHKKFASSIKEETLESLSSYSKNTLLEIFNEVELKYARKKENINKIYEQNLNLIKKNALIAKQETKKNSDQRIYSIPSQIETFFTNLMKNLSSQIQEELKIAEEELKKADEKNDNQIKDTIEIYDEKLKTLEKEREQELQDQNQQLQEKLNNSLKEIDQIQVKAKAFTDEFMNMITETTQKYHIEFKETSYLLRNFIKQSQKTTDMAESEAKNKVRNDFEIEKIEFSKKLNQKYSEKEQAVEKVREENLDFIKHNTLQKKEEIRNSLDKKINSITPLTIEDLGKTFIQDLSSMGNKNEERVTSSEVHQQHESNEQDELLAANSLQENILQENQVTIASLEDSTEKSPDSLELTLSVSFESQDESPVQENNEVQSEEKDTLEKNEIQSQGSLMTTISDTCNGVYNGLYEILARTVQNIYPR